MNDKRNSTGWTIRSITIVCSLWMVFGLPIITAAQSDGLFETATVKHLIKQQFNLSSRDIKVLGPLVERENEDLLTILGRCSDEESTNYMSLWNSIVRANMDFEAGRLSGLTSTQKRALRKARIELESRILDHWLDGYLQALGEILELDWLQTNSVAIVFENDFESRFKLLAAGTSEPVSNHELWMKLSEQRDARLEKLLTPSQLREYHSLNGPVDRLVGRYSN